jgi:hypothetical protein
VLRLHYDLGFVEYGPLPPHERTWRHPSELAAQEHALARAETTPATTRVFAITSGTLGLLAIGLLVLAVTPDRSGSPVAISATTTTAITDDPATTAALAVTEPSVRNPIALRGRSEALATPIGAGRFAVVTAADLAGAAEAAVIGDEVEVEVPSGRMHDARVVGRAGDTVLVELEQREPGLDLAVDHPDGHEIVTVLADPPVTIVLDDLSTFDFEEGTAVLDGDGDLVGLCSRDDDATRLLVVSGEMLDDDVRFSDEPVVATTDG